MSTSSRTKSCPRCRGSIPIEHPISDLDRELVCPHCRARLRVNRRHRGDSANPAPPAAPPPRNADHDHEPPVVDTILDDDAAVDFWGNEPDVAPPETATSRGGFLTNPRGCFRALSLGIKWIIPAVGLLIAAPVGAPAAALFFVAWWWAARWLGDPVARRLTSLLVPEFSCPGCGLNYPCVETWRCSCGYQPARRQHVLNFHCARCEKRIGFFECLQCRTTIRLQ